MYVNPILFPRGAINVHFYDYTRFFIDTKILTKLLVTKNVIEIFFSKLSNVKLSNIKNILVLGITTDECFVFGVNETP